MLFVEVAHEKLLDLQAAGIPPGQADQECIGSCAAGKPGGFGVEEQPLRLGRRGGLRALGKRDIARAAEQFESAAGGLGKFRRREPVAHRHMFAVVIRGNRSAQQAGERVFFLRCAPRRWTRAPSRERA